MVEELLRARAHVRLRPFNSSNIGAKALEWVLGHMVPEPS